MPKLKTKKSISRRFRVTPRGKVLHRSSFRGHLRSHKSATQRRRYKKVKLLPAVRARKIKLILGK